MLSLHTWKVPINYMNRQTLHFKFPAIIKAVNSMIKTRNCIVRNLDFNHAVY